MASPLKKRNIGVASQDAQGLTPEARAQQVANWDMADNMRNAGTESTGGYWGAMARMIELQQKRNNQAQGDAAEQRSWEQAALSAMSPEEQAAYQQQKAQNTRYGSDLSWLDPSFKMDPTLLGQSAGSQVYADQGAIDAQRGLLGQQQNLANQQLQWGSDANQRDVLARAMGLSTNSGPGSLQFDNGARQGEQYGNLRDIIAGGGANAIEMADRQRQRADSESWLRGQREADMADYAERGLTGSGMELLSLSADRQAAAGRNSLADLQMAKDLEQRRMDAIGAASGLATNMRGQTIDEQALLNQRSQAGLSTAANVANTMRSQTADEQIAGRNAQQDALTNAAGLANQMRTSSFNEGESRASAGDQFSILNNQATNAAKNANTTFMQNAWQTMQNNRQQWDMGQAQLNAQTAQSKYATDAAQNTEGYRQALQLAMNNADMFNDAQRNYISQLLGVSGAGNAAVANASAAANNAVVDYAGGMGAMIDFGITSGVGAMGNNAAGGGAGSAGSGAFGSSAGGAGRGAAPKQSQTPWSSGDIMDPWKQNNFGSGYSGY